MNKELSFFFQKYSYIIFKSKLIFFCLTFSFVFFFYSPVFANVTDSISNVLNEDFLEENALEIEVIGYREDSINRAEISNRAGAKRVSPKDIEAVSQDVFNDVTTILSTTSEITTLGDFSALTVVRGVDRNSYYLNGIPFKYPYRWGGYLTVFNPTYVEYIDIYTGRVPFLYSNSLSGVIDVEYEKDVSDSLRVLVDLGVESNLLINIPAKIASFGIGYRRSLYDLFADFAINDLEEDSSKTSYNFPFFEDFYLNGTVNINKNHRLYGSMILLTEDGGTSFNSGFNDTTSVVSLNYNGKLSKELGILANVGRNFSKKKIKYQNDFKPENIKYENILYRINYLSAQVYYLKNKYKGSYGFSLEDFKMNQFNSYNFNENTEVLTKDFSFVPSIYTDNRVDFTQEFSAYAGIHLDYISKLKNRKILFSPEIGAKYNFKKGGVLNGNFSYIEKIPRIYTPTEYFANYTFSPEKALHTTLAHEILFTDRLLLKTVLAYSKYKNLMTLENQTNSAQVDYKGLSLSLERKRGKYTRFDGWVNYTLSQTNYEDSIGGFYLDYPSAYDIRHNFKAGLNIVIYKNKFISIENKNKLIYQTPTPYQNIGRNVRQELGGINSPGQKEISINEFSDKSRPEDGIFRWDTGVYFGFPKLKNLSLYAQIINVTSSKNIDFYEIESVDDEFVTLSEYYSPFVSRFFVGGIRIDF